MKKRFFAVVLSIYLICSTFVFAQEDCGFNVTPYNFKIFWNGNEFKADSPVLLVNGQTYVPLRDFSEQLSMDVHWDVDAQEIRITEHHFDVYEIFYDLYQFDLPPTATIEDYAYERFGRDVSLKAKIFFEEQDLEYIKENIEIRATPLESNDSEYCDLVMSNFSREYDWWNISSIKDSQYAYHGFAQGTEVMTIPIWGLICKSPDSTGYYLYISH